MSEPLLSLVIPTYNEAQGLQSLVEQIFAATRARQIPVEVIVVDDGSPDGTGQVAEALGRTYAVRVVHREGKLGLSSAVLAGWAVARGGLLAVMDADLSHDPAILPDLVESLTLGGAEVAVGSRYAPGGGMANWPWSRRFVSWVAIQLGRPVSPVGDVTSGYLAFRREVIEGVSLDPIGFKIGLEVLVRGRYQTFTEVPFVFVDRTAGKSKFGAREVWNYLVQLGRLVRHVLRVRPRRRRVPPSSSGGVRPRLPG